jgi:hypothetical protein
MREMGATLPELIWNREHGGNGARLVKAFVAPLESISNHQAGRGALAAHAGVGLFWNWHLRSWWPRAAGGVNWRCAAWARGRGAARDGPLPGVPCVAGSGARAAAQAVGACAASGSGMSPAAGSVRYPAIAMTMSGRGFGQG